MNFLVYRFLNVYSIHRTLSGGIGNKETFWTIHGFSKSATHVIVYDFRSNNCCDDEKQDKIIATFSRKLLESI